MRPFVETPIVGSKPLPASLFEYDLFAVVTHEGKLDNGHYWADVLSGDQWWHCDDDKGESLTSIQWIELNIVTPTILKDVLAQKAYMLFYVKRSLAYAQPLAKLLSNANGSTVAPQSSNTAAPIALAAPPLPDSTAGHAHAQQSGKGPNPYTGRGGHPITGMQV